MSITSRILSIFKSSGHRILDKIEDVNERAATAMIKQNEVIENLNKSTIILGTTLNENRLLVQEFKSQAAATEMRIGVILKLLEMEEIKLNDKKYAEINIELDVHAEKLVDIISQIETYQNTCDSIQPKLDQLYQRVKVEMSNKQKLQHDINNLKSQYAVAQASVKVSELIGSTTVDGIESILTDIKSRVRTMQSKSMALDQLESKINPTSTIIDDTIRSMGARDHIDRIKKSMAG